MADVTVSHYEQWFLNVERTTLDPAEEWPDTDVAGKLVRPDRLRVIYEPPDEDDPRAGQTALVLVSAYASGFVVLRDDKPGRERKNIKLWPVPEWAQQVIRHAALTEAGWPILREVARAPVEH